MKDGKPTSEALILLANQVLNRNLDVLEGDVGGARRPDTLAVHLAGADTAEAPLDEEKTDAVHAGTAGAHGGGEVVAPDTVGDPLLLTVDDVVLAVGAELSLAIEAGDVATRIGLSDGEADPLVTGQDTGEDAVDEALLAELEEGRASDSETADEVPDETTGGSAADLIGDDQLVEEIPLLGGHALDRLAAGVLGGVVYTEETGEVASAAHLLVDFGIDQPVLIPLGDIGLNGGLDPLTNLGTEGSMGFVEVRGVVLWYAPS